MASRLKPGVKAYQKNPAVQQQQNQNLAAQQKQQYQYKVLAKGPPKGQLPGAAPPAPISAPVPAPAPAPTPMPWDANYEQRVSGINRTKASNLAALDTEETGTKQAYGFDDLSNPFSRLALLKEKFSQQQAGTTNSMAAAGQLYSGALTTQRSSDQHDQDINYDAMRRQYTDALAGITQRRTSVSNTAEDELTGAKWDRTQAALTNRPDPASVPATPALAAAAPAAKAYTVKSGKDSKGNKGDWHIYPDGRKVFVRK